MRRAPGPPARSATARADRFVRMEGSRLDGAAGYPTPGDGHSFRMNVFGLIVADTEIMALQRCLWNRESFLPTAPARPLEEAPLADLSDIAGSQSVVGRDGASPGLLAQNRLRATVAERLGEKHFRATMDLIAAFKREKEPGRRAELAQRVSNTAYWAQWLIRGVLFEGKLHWEQYCEAVVRAPLSKIAFAANAALGRHQIEFVYVRRSPGGGRRAAHGRPAGRLHAQGGGPVALPRSGGA